jgi:hypothetical protein
LVCGRGLGCSDGGGEARRNELHNRGGNGGVAESSRTRRSMEVAFYRW